MQVTRSDAMDGNDLTARDPRILAILTNPDRYFLAARRHAWEQAGRDVRDEVDRRARARRNGGRAGSSAQSATGPGVDTAR